jgi:hypothetical protein
VSDADDGSVTSSTDGCTWVLLAESGHYGPPVTTIAPFLRNLREWEGTDELFYTENKEGKKKFGLFAWTGIETDLVHAAPWVMEERT